MIIGGEGSVTSGCLQCRELLGWGVLQLELGNQRRLPGRSDLRARERSEGGSEGLGACAKPLELRNVSRLLT